MLVNLNNPNFSWKNYRASKPSRKRGRSGMEAYGALTVCAWSLPWLYSDYTQEPSVETLKFLENVDALSPLLGDPGDLVKVLLL